MTSLTDFLLARITEDEAAAEAAKNAPEVYGNFNDREAHAELLELARNEGASEAAGAHAARWDPVRVLAECAARRSLIELLAEHSDHGISQGTAELLLRIVAAPFVDHPDFPGGVR